MMVGERRSSLGFCRRRSEYLAVLTGVLVLAGCTGSISDAAGVQVPTLDDFPTSTNQATIALSGTKGRRNQVWFSTTAGATMVSDATASNSWSGEVTLQPGINDFVLFGSAPGPTAVSQPTGVFRITLDTGVPNDPVVDPFPNPLFLGTGTTLSFTFTGTKDADANLLLDGSEVVGFDGLPNWSVTVDLPAGDSTLTFASADDAGNQSGDVAINVNVNSVPPPTLANFQSPTNQTTQALSGTKSANTSVWILDVASGVETEIDPDDATTDWSAVVSLLEGDNPYEIFARQAGVAERSQPVQINIVLDTIAPEAPELTVSSGVVGTETVTIEGSRPADGNLCVRIGQEPACTELLPEDGGTTFSEQLGVEPGFNWICISSVDLAGNQSAEVCISIERVVPPVIAILAPVENSVVNGSSVEVRFDATYDNSIAEAAVVSAEACLGATCVAATNTSGDRWSATLVLAGLTDGQPLEFTANATNGLGGVGTAVVNTVFAEGNALVLSDSVDANSNQPSIAITTDATTSVQTIHFVYSDRCIEQGDTACPESQSTNSPSDIFYRSFTNGTFSQIMLISDSIGDGDSVQPVIEADSNGILHIVWADNGNINSAGSDFDLYHRTLDPATSTLGTVTLITDATLEASAGLALEDRFPSLAADTSGDMHLVWERQISSIDRDVYYSIYSGNLWGGLSYPVLVSADAFGMTASTDGDSRFPDISTDRSGQAHIVWQESGDMSGWGTDNDIAYAIVDGVNITGFPREVTNLESVAPLVGESRLPRVVVLPDPDTPANDMAHIVWQDDTILNSSGSDTDVFWRRYVNGAPAVNSLQYSLVSIDDEASEAPDVVADPVTQGVAFVWAQEDMNTGDRDIQYATTSVFSINPPVILSPNSGASVAPRGVVDASQNLHVVWEDASTIKTSDGNNQQGQPDTDIFYNSESIQ